MQTWMAWWCYCFKVEEWIHSSRIHLIVTVVHVPSEFCRPFRDPDCHNCEQCTNAFRQANNKRIHDKSRVHSEQCVVFCNWKHNISVLRVFCFSGELGLAICPTGCLPLIPKQILCDNWQRYLTGRLPFQSLNQPVCKYWKKFNSLSVKNIKSHKLMYITLKYKEPSHHRETVWKCVVYGDMNRASTQITHHSWGGKQRLFWINQLHILWSQLLKCFEWLHECNGWMDRQKVQTSWC